MKYIIILLSLFCTSCDNGYTISTRETLANKIIAKTAEKLQKEKNLIPIGTGGRMMDRVEMLAISFAYYHEINIETGRDLLISSIKELVSAINGNEAIRPHLNNYPFETKNIEIRIFIFTPNGATPPKGKITAICAIDDILSYRIYDEADRLKIIYKESYLETISPLWRTP